MEIGIIGAGAIGSLLLQKLSIAGYDVKVAAVGGPETIDTTTLSKGGRVVTLEEAVSDAHVIIVAVPPTSIPDVARLFSNLPAETVVIDTSIHLPQRDGDTPAPDNSQPVSMWVAEQLGRPVAKAWGTVTAESLACKGRPEGDNARLAIPVSADCKRDRNVAMALVEDTGFDAIDAGPLIESWRQEPGCPAYGTDLKRDEMRIALASAGG